MSFTFPFQSQKIANSRLLERLVLAVEADQR
jgi:hypothetical protein